MSEISVIESLEDEEKIIESKNIVVADHQTNNQLDTHENIDTLPNNKNDSPSVIPSRITENFVIIWLELNANELNRNIDDSIGKLQHIVNSLKIFTDLDESIDFLSDIRYEQIFMILSGSCLPYLVSLIEEIPKLRSIYVFDSQSTDDEQWLREHKKVKGIFTQIDGICDTLRKDIYGLMIDLTPFSIIPRTTTDINELDQSFMYTQILKEIILKTKHDENAKKEFVKYCLNEYQDNTSVCNNIHKFDQEYPNPSPLWWYAKEMFLYLALNAALRTENVELIIKMGFFLHDLHQEIERKYSETHSSSKLVVYRGQGMSNVDFDKLKKNEGGLFSFNSFLSTSVNCLASMTIAESVVSATNNDDKMGILFQLEIDSSIPSSPYTSLDGISLFTDEREILFSMHTIFRIGEILEIGNRLWVVNLMLTSDNDPQLKHLTDYIRREIGGVDGWFSLGTLLQKMGKLNKALEVYETLLETPFTLDLSQQQTVRQLTETMISQVHRAMGNYSDAFEHLEQAQKTCQDSDQSNQLMLFKLYDGIASVHLSSGNYSKALEFYKKTLDIGHNTLSADHEHFMVIYNHIGLTYQSMGDYSIALSYYEKVRVYQEKQLPLNHPDVAANLHNIGLVHAFTGNYTMALTSLEKAFEINQKVLPPDHLDLALNSISIANVYQAIGNLTVALSYAEKALEIQKSGPINHPNLPIIYSNIGAIHLAARNYLVALTSYEKAIDIYRETHSLNSPDLGRIYSNVAVLHQLEHNHATALLYYEKAVHIFEKTLSPNHPDLVIHYVNIGQLQQSMGDNLTALKYMEKALKIGQNSLHSDHPKLAYCYCATGTVYESMGSYSEALSYFEKARDIYQKTLAPNHPDLVALNNRIAWRSMSTVGFLSAITDAQKPFENEQIHSTTDQPSSACSLANVNEMLNKFNFGSPEMLQMAKYLEPLFKLYSSDVTEETVTTKDVTDVAEGIAGLQVSTEAMEKSIETLMSSPLSNHPSTLSRLTNANDRNAAVQHLSNALSANKQMLKMISDTLSTPNNIAQTDSIKELEPIMLAHMDKFYEVLESSLPKNSPFIVDFYINSGVMFLQVKNFSTALTYFQKALGVLNESFPNNFSMLAITYNNIAKALAGLGEYIQAAEYAQQAVIIANNDIESTSDRIKSYEDDLHYLQSLLFH